MAYQGNNVVLAHWDYSPGEWERYFSSDWHRYSVQFWRSIRITAWRLLAAGAIVGVLILILGGWLAAIFIFLCYGTTAIPLLVVFALARFALERNRNRLLRLVPPEITITPDVVVFGRPDYPQANMVKRLHSFGTSVSASVEQGDPPTLRFALSRRYQGEPVLVEEIRVPIPGGHEDEARAVAANELWK